MSAALLLTRLATSCMPVPVSNQVLLAGGAAALVLLAAGVYWQQTSGVENGTLTPGASKAAQRQGMSRQTATRTDDFDTAAAGDSCDRSSYVEWWDRGSGARLP